MDSTAPVFDPNIPVRHLRHAAAGEDKTLIAFGAGKSDLDKSQDRLDAATLAYVLAAFVAAALLIPSGILLSHPPPDRALGAILGTWGLIVGSGVASLLPRLMRYWGVTTLAIQFHGRYVLPASDFDPEASELWDRTVKASNIIEEARVVREGRTDTARLSAMLPRWRWEIAEGLARLSAARTAQRALLAGVDVRAPEIAALARPQQQAHDLATADIEHRLRRLEDFARQVAAAEAALRKVQAVQELPALNDPHLDLLAHVGTPEAGQAITDQDVKAMTADLPAVMAEAAEALRVVNETVRALTVPAHPADGNGPDA